MVEPRPERPARRPSVDLDTPFVTPAGRETKRCAALTDAVVQVDEAEWLVSRELIACYTTHLRQLDAMAYTVWVDEEDGRGHLGVRVSPTRGPDGDIARAAGLRRGDVLLGVGGVRIRSWADVALLAPRLAVNGRYRLRVLRGDEEVTLTYRVRTPRRFAKMTGGVGIAAAE